MQLDPEAGVSALESGLKSASVSKLGLGVQWFGRVFGRDRSEVTINLSAKGFTAKLLLRLLRLAYRHVRSSEDERHEASYSFDTRDYAEHARNAILNAVLATTGPEGWEAKLEMANDPLFTHFKDRAIALAKEKAAEEADSTPLSEADCVSLEKYGESPPSTRDAMFQIMRDRLDDIDDLLKRDVSPREAWAGIRDEKLLRRELARELDGRRSHVYTVDQESVTADEKETDIRLRAAKSAQQGTIELKIGDNRAARDLRDTLKNQLLTKYMAADECKAGCLVVSISKDRNWEHPETGQRIAVSGLERMLNEEAERLEQDLGGTVKLAARLLDLRPRLTTEKSSTTPKRTRGKVRKAKSVKKSKAKKRTAVKKPNGVVKKKKGVVRKRKASAVRSQASAR